MNVLNRILSDGLDYLALLWWYSTRDPLITLGVVCVAILLILFARGKGRVK